MNLWLLTIPLAYLLGSIPFGCVLVRLFLHQDTSTPPAAKTL
jgi:glycerol-3-phosphate acyltransferase PlsY